MRAVHFHLYEPAARRRRTVDTEPFDEAKHPRRDDGKFGHGRGNAKIEQAAPAKPAPGAEDDDDGGGDEDSPQGTGQPTARQNTSAAVQVTLKPHPHRVFTGQPVPTQNTLTKIDSGATGEAIAIEWLKANGIPDARALNLDKTNYPVDLIGDHQLIEVKAGLVANDKGAQKWRATIGGKSKEEAAWYKAASPEQRKDWNKQKSLAIMARKKAVLAEYSQKMGVPMKAKTLTTIINPDTKTADVYLFDDFHMRIGWNSAAAKAAHVGTFSYA